MQSKRVVSLIIYVVLLMLFLSKCIPAVVVSAYYQERLSVADLVKKAEL